VISIMSTSPADDRRYYQKYRGFKRCAVLHDKTRTTVSSRFAPGVQLRVREAVKARNLLKAGLDSGKQLQQLHDLVQAQVEVFKRLHTVLLAAEAVNASATYEHVDGTIAVNKDLLINMGVLAGQAGEEALRQMQRIDEICGRLP
jgi:hypothetical protein